jgi:hypothetical protein
LGIKERPVKTLIKILALGWLLGGGGRLVAAPSADEYLAASRQFEALIAEAEREHKAPHITDERTAALVSALSDVRVLTSTTYGLKDLGLLMEICGKAHTAMLSYALFDLKAHLDPKADPTTKSLQAHQVMDRNIELFQSELSKIQPFLVRCLATAAPLLSEFIATLKPEEVTESRREGLQQVREGILGTYTSFMVNVGNMRFSEAYRLNLLETLADTASTLAQPLKPEARRRLVDLSKTIEITAPSTFRQYLTRIAEAMSNPSCDGLCAF